MDRDAGVIRGVKLLGWASANGREYLPAGVDPALYEGRVVNIDHAASGKSASARDRFRTASYWVGAGSAGAHRLLRSARGSRTRVVHDRTDDAMAERCRVVSRPPAAVIAECVPKFSGGVPPRHARSIY